MKSWSLSVFKSTSSIESVLTLVSPSVFITQETDENKEKNVVKMKCKESERKKEGRKKDRGRKEESERGAERKKSSVQGDRNTGV